MISVSYVIKLPVYKTKVIYAVWRDKRDWMRLLFCTMLWPVALSEDQFLLMTGKKTSSFAVYQKSSAYWLGKSGRVLAEDPGVSSQAVCAASSRGERSGRFDAEALER
jgi:hypothetical protein